MLASALLILAQEPGPATRAEILAREREVKSQALTPPEIGRVERTLLSLENGRFFERLLAPPEGFYPRLGQITSGSGFTIAPAYRRPRLLGERADFTAFAALSYKKYWMLDAKLALPELADGRVFADVHGRMFEFPSEQFFGLGPASLRGDEAVYGIRSSQVGAAGGVRPTPWLSLGAGLDWLTPSVGRGRGGTSIEDLFNTRFVPGLEAQPDFARWELSADINVREPRGNPRRGGQYKVAYIHFDDLDLQRYSFSRVDVDLQQYVPLLKERRILALRAAVSTSDVEVGQQVPFYLQRTLGGPDDLRGFRRFRFRDENSILLQAEYRWEIFTAVDGAWQPAIPVALARAPAMPRARRSGRRLMPAAAVALHVLAQVGAGPEHVTRTRMMLTDITRWRESADVHGEDFRDVGEAMKPRACISA